MVLAYCVAPPGARKLPFGIARFVCDQVECFFAERSEPIAELQQEAIAFFQKNQELFAQGDILEFRFPTLLETLADLEAFLASNAAQLTTELARLKNMASVTVYPVESDSGTVKPGSGTEY